MLKQGCSKYPVIRKYLQNDIFYCQDQEARTSYIYLQKQAFRSSSLIKLIFLVFFRCYIIKSNEMKKGTRDFSSFCIFQVRDDTQMTSMKTVQFSRPPTPLVQLRPKFFHPLVLRRLISNEPPSLSK